MLLRRLRRRERPDQGLGAVFISDTEGNFIHFNEAFATFHQFKNKEECAKTLKEYPAFLDVYLPDGSLARLEQWAVPRALRGETCSNAEFTLKRRDTGDTWTGAYNFAPIRNVAGAIMDSVVTGRDITQRKKAEDALRGERNLSASWLSSTTYGTSRGETIMTSLSASQARASLFKLMEQTADSHEPIQINGRRRSAILISEEDWRAIQETLHLLSIPGMRESIRCGLKTPLSKTSKTLKW